MAVSKNIERRRHCRVGFTAQIQILLEADGKTIHLEADSTDLSLKGIFIPTENRFSIGTTCIITLYLTGGIDKIELLIKGSVVRVSDKGMGIGFDSMDVDAYSHLKNIVAYNRVED